ncbi:MAG: long-chain fatty acid--CoA ligase [Acidobacteria bacterium]|nr:long-chain fatty acid--CoA ligase [Acidobacteriota bacterium]
MDDTLRNLNELFIRAVNKFNKKDMFYYKHSGEWLMMSHTELANRVQDLAMGLMELGVSPGDRVALLCEHRPEWSIIDLAILSCGGVVVPIYATQIGSQIEYIVNDSHARMIFVSTRAQLEKVLSVAQRMDQLEYIVVIDRVTLPHTVKPVMQVSELEQYGRPAPPARSKRLQEVRAGIRREDVATIIYTSGTTGVQKGVILMHGNLLSNVAAALADFDIGDKDIALSFLPMAHVFERTVMYCYLDRGVSVYFAESIDAVAANMKEVRPTLMTSVPRLFEKAYQKILTVGNSGSPLKRRIFRWAMDVGKKWAVQSHTSGSVGLILSLEYKMAWRLVFSKWPPILGGRMRFCLVGGAALPPDLSYIFLAGGVLLLQGYGLTETSPVITVNTPQANRIGTVGRVISNVEVKLAADGEILVHGPNVMQGYFNLAKESEEVFTSDGWLRTGDIGEFDKDGFLRITDRKKDLIKTSGGKYICPQLIEGQIKISRFVSQVVVIGNGRKFPAALIVPNFETLTTEAAAMGIIEASRNSLVARPPIIHLLEQEVDRLTPELAKYEKIKKVALLANELTLEGGELTPTLKVKRRVVEEKYKSAIDKLYESGGES